MEPGKIGSKKTNPSVWQSFYRYLMSDWFNGLTAPDVQAADLKYAGVQDSGMAMNTAKLLEKRKLANEEMLRQMDAGNPGILQSPTVRAR